MGFVYRYIDLNDNKIKYVGIVFGATRTLEDRIKEHTRDYWYHSGDWKIEYIREQIDTRSEAEAFEAHYISLFHTDEFYNVAKSGWGINKFLPDRTNDFVEYMPCTDDGVASLSGFELDERIPFWKKYTLSINEAAAYFRIGENCLRKIVSENKEANFILWNGNRPQIKRLLFEQYIDGINSV